MYNIEDEETSVVLVFGSDAGGVASGGCIGFSVVDAKDGDGGGSVCGIISNRIIWAVVVDKAGGRVISVKVVEVVKEVFPGVWK